MDTPFHCTKYNSSHLPRILELCRAEGWPIYPNDPAGADRAFSAPGVTTVIALHRETPLGFAQLLSDVELQAYLALLLVELEWRRHSKGAYLLWVGNGGRIPD